MVAVHEVASSCVMKVCVKSLGVVVSHAIARLFIHGVEHIEAETGLKTWLWEKCLLCAEKLAACSCANAQEPCLDCGETFARCMCDGQ